MSEELRASQSEDLTADTERFRRFAQSGGDGEGGAEGGGKAVGVPFRLLTLAAGLIILALFVWLLLGAL
jgi:hypothetical protein